MIEIFPMEKKHLEEVAAAEKEIFSDPWTYASLSSYLESSVQKSYVATEENEVVGYLLATSLLGEGEILRIAVKEKARKKGVAKALFSHFLPDLDSVFLEVRSQNTAARCLYEALGFQQTGTRKNYYKNPQDDAVLYYLQQKGQTV